MGAEVLFGFILLAANVSANEKTMLLLVENATRNENDLGSHSLSLGLTDLSQI